jgi:hypothetical protein
VLTFDQAIDFLKAYNPNQPRDARGRWVRASDVVAAVSTKPAAQPKAAKPVRQPKPKIPATFAERVKQIASALKTPPFQGRVAIAQVYDAYKQKYRGDSPNIENFKIRLVNAAKRRELDLGRLDLPEHMDRDLRQRSAAAWGKDEVHFVVHRWE